MKFPRAMYSLRMSFWVVPRSCSRLHALLLADQLVEQQQHRGGRVDRHRRRDLVERDAVEHPPHVVDRVDGDAGAADLALAERVVGVAAELGGQVEGHRQAGRAVVDQVVEALVGLLGGRVAGVLAHRPAAVAVHPLVDAAREGVLARLAEPLLEVLRQVVLGVERLDLDARVGEARAGRRGRRSGRWWASARAWWPSGEGYGRGASMAAWRSRSACSPCCASAPARARSCSSCPTARSVRDALAALGDLAEGLPLVMAVNREYAPEHQVLGRRRRAGADPAGQRRRRAVHAAVTARAAVAGRRWPRACATRAPAPSSPSRA